MLGNRNKELHYLCIHNCMSLHSKKNFHKELFRIKAMTSFLKTLQTHHTVLFTVSGVRCLHISYLYCSTTGYQSTTVRKKQIHPKHISQCVRLCPKFPLSVLGAHLYPPQAKIRTFYVFYTGATNTVAEDKPKHFTAQRQCVKEKHSKKERRGNLLEQSTP